MLKRKALGSCAPGDTRLMNTTRAAAGMLERRQPGPARSMECQLEPLESSRKRQRAASRRQLHGEEMTGLWEDKTFLERKSVTTAREKSYARAMSLFNEFVLTEKMNVGTVEQIDVAATRLLNHMFWDGEDLSAGQTLGAALVFYRHDINKVNGLPRLNTALKGFRKLEPPQGRVPMPFAMLCRVCQVLHQQGQDQVLLWLMTIWGGCTRPGESLRLQANQVVKTSRMCKNYILIINSGQEGGVRMTSKVGEMDEAVEIDQPYLQWLGPALNRLKSTRSPQERVFSFTREEGVAHFDRVVHQLNYHKVGIQCVYQLRHGSASADALEKFRTLDQIQKRGRWHCAKSVRRYANGGRISQVFQELSQEEQRQASAAESEIVKIIGPALGRTACKR